MIEYLRLKKFQKHGDQKIVLDPHCTTVVGENEAGKTAFIRGLLWTTLNVWNKRFLQFGANCATAILGVDGHKIIRKQGKSVNTYKLDDQTYRAFGKKVPPQIAELLRIQPTNIQEQITLPFWFSNTPGEVSRALNKIVNLDSIDDSLSFCNTELQEAKHAIKESKERLAEIQAEKERTAFVPALVAQVEALHQRKIGLDEKRSRINLLEGLLYDGEILRLHTKYLGELILAGRRLLEIGRRYKQKRKQRKHLAKLLKKYEGAKSLANVELPRLEALDQRRNEADKVAERRRRLEYLIKDYEDHKENKCLAEKEIKERSSQLDRLIVRLKRCPTCGTKLTNRLQPQHRTCTTGT